ncbi:MAG: hypothetical protein WBN04_13580 [Paracoccaceae bacterium]
MAEESEVQRIFEEDRRLALESTRAWLDALDDTEREIPFINVGGREFTPREVLGEIEERSEYGRIFVSQASRQRLEEAKRSEEIDAEVRKLED